MHRRDPGSTARGSTAAGASARRAARLNGRRSVTALRRVAATAALGILAPVAALVLAGCGSSSGQLKVTLSVDDPTQTYAPGDQATVTVMVTNNGPGAVNGITVHGSLPSGFTYRSTTDGDSTGYTRTQPLTADVNSTTPLWGVWDLGAPGTAGPGILSQVTFSFTMQVEGHPGKALVSAYAVGDASTGQFNAAPLALTVTAAPKLGISASVTPTAATPGNSVVYRVRVTNTGTSAASIAVLITLPAGMTYTSSITPFAGNASRASGTNPAKNALLVYYDGFTLPANSSAGPGYIDIAFRATVVNGAAPGSSTIDVSVTDAVGDIVAVHAVAPVVINPGAATPSPRPTQSSTPVPSQGPQNIPVATPTH